jgi:AraC-like DNA-binding protein
MGERVAGSHFVVHDESGTSRIAESHRHEYFQVQLNLSGETVQHIAAVTRPLRAGFLSFVLPYRIHRVPHPPGSRFYVINFTHRFLRPELDIDVLDLDDVPLERAPELAPFLFQEFADFSLQGTELGHAERWCGIMREESERRAYCSGEIVRAHLLLLLATVCRRHERVLLELAGSHAERRSRREALARVMRHVRARLGQRITLAEAAAAAELSPHYLAHLIKKETGRTFVDLVTERRMEKARELLAHSTLRISQIAQLVGFEDEAYFARRFRQLFALAPSAYRDRARLGGTAR